MNKFLMIGAAAMAMLTGGAMAQTQTSTSQTTTTVLPAPAPAPPILFAPPADTLSTTRTTSSLNSDGTSVQSKETTYRNTAGVADDSMTRTTTYPAPTETTTTTNKSSRTTIYPAPTETTMTTNKSSSSSDTR